MQQLEGAIHDLEAVSVDLQTLKKSSLTEIQSLVSSVGSLSEGFKSVPNALPLQDLPKGIPDDNSIVEKDVLAAELKAIKLKYERVYKRLKSQESANLLLNDKLKEAQEEIKISKDQLMNGKNVAKHTSWDHLIASVHQDSELIRGIQEQLIHSMETHSKNNFISISEHQLLQEQFAICIRQKSEGAVLCKTLTETVQEQSNELNSLKQCKSELQKQLDEIMHRYDKASKSVDYLKIQCNKVVSELNSKNAMMKNLSESLRKAELIAKEETKEKLALSQYNEELKRR